MKARTRFGLLGVGGSLLLSAATHAEFLGLVCEPVYTYNDGATNWVVLHLFAEFDNTTDQLITVAGSPGSSNSFIESTGTLGFFQESSFGGDIEHNRSLDFAVPGLFADSFVTIGANDTSPGEPGPNTTTTPGFTPTQTASFNAGGPLNVSNGAWARMPIEPQTFAHSVTTSSGDNAYRVMFAQLTCEAFAQAQGTVNLIVVADNVSRYVWDQPICNEAVGACCFEPPQACLLTTPDQCTDLGGLFLGIGMACEQHIRESEYTGTHWVHRIRTASNCPGQERVPPCVSGPAFIDSWITSEQGTSCEDFSHPDSCPIPADFFGPGSDPFTGQVCFVGEPIGPTTIPGFNDGNPIDFAGADTLVRRDADPFDRCSLSSVDPVTVGVVMERLSLVSVDPISVTFNGGQDPEEWNVRVAVDYSAGQPATGSITAMKTHCNGGTFSSSITFCPRFVFTRVSDPGIQLELDFCASCDPAGITVTAEDLTWVHDSGDNVDVLNPVCTTFIAGLEVNAPVTDCDCNLNGVRDRCDIEQSVSANCNANDLPDECEALSPCSGNTNGDCTVNQLDFMMVLNEWGVCGEPCPSYCPGDATRDCLVDTDDLLAVLIGWGPCIAP